MYAGSGMGQLAKVRSTCRMLNVITCSIRQTLLDCSELCTKFSRPVLLNGTFNPRFYLESSAGFEGRELCDCFRPEGPWDPDFERRVEENRFYSRPERQLLLSFIQVFGGFPVHGHFPGRCRGAGHGGKFRESCSPANITREELTEAGRVLEPDEYDSNPGMEADWSNYFDWTGDVPTVLERIVTHMNVNTLVLS
mmetsp:Transcript_76806/g.207045  ORF Transcript_76806/g.207045 Transcript_76806/m.207045 type:complete len:195 (-) Transcript_76806:1607-2191(-)